MKLLSLLILGAFSLSFAAVDFDNQFAYREIKKPTSMRLFLQVDGIRGSSVDRQHVNWIDVIAFSNGANLVGAGTGGGTGSGSLYLHELMVVKNIDKASPSLALFLCRRSSIPRAVFEAVSTVPGSPVSLVRYEFRNVIVQSLRTVPGSKMPQEVLSLAFQSQQTTVYTASGSIVTNDASRFAIPMDSAFSIKDVYSTPAAFAATKNYSLFGKFYQINGSSQDSRHRNWCDGSDWGFAVSMPLATAGRANFQDIAFVKKIDAASSALPNSITRWSILSSVQFDFVANGARGPASFWKCDLGNSRVTSTRIYTGPDGEFYEMVMVQYETIRWTYLPDDGSAAVMAGWNLRTNSPF